MALNNLKLFAKRFKKSLLEVYKLMFADDRNSHALLVHSRIILHHDIVLIRCYAGLYYKNNQIALKSYNLSTNLDPRALKCSIKYFPDPCDLMSIIGLLTYLFDISKIANATISNESFPYISSPVSVE